MFMRFFNFSKCSDLTLKLHNINVNSYRRQWEWQMVPSEGVLVCTVAFYLGISFECMLYFIVNLFLWFMAINCKSFSHLLQFLKMSKCVDQTCKLLCITVYYYWHQWGVTFYSIRLTGWGHCTSWCNIFGMYK